MIEFDTQIIPTARAMSFLFFWARSAFKVRKEFYVTYGCKRYLSARDARKGPCNPLCYRH